MSHSKELRRITIKEMLDKRYTVDEIAVKTGISTRTIYRYMKKFRVEATSWFQSLASHDFIPELKSTMDMINANIKQCHEQIEKIEKKYDQMINEAKLLYEETKNLKDSMRHKIQIHSKICDLECDRLKEQKDYIKLIQDFEIKRSQVLHKVPMIFAIDYVMKKKSLHPEPTPQIDALKLI